MKRKILASVIGIAAAMAVTSAHAQGKFSLNTYADSGAQIIYGTGIPGVTQGGFINNNSPAGVTTWNIGFYYALGDVRANVGADASGTADPSTLGGGLGLASGVAGDNGVIANTGWFLPNAGGNAIVNGWSAGAVTIEVVAYSGATYGASQYKGHSTAFLLTPIPSTAGSPAPLIGSVMPGFAVNGAVPEPSIFALAGLGAAALMALRRKK